MVKYWWKLGFILPDQLHDGTDHTKKVFVEKERAEYIQEVPQPPKITSVDDLKRHLESAMLVELSTIPVYLYAMYSIKDEKMGAIAQNIIRGVIGEEMLHVCLSGNVLKSIGGTPRLYRLHNLLITYTDRIFLNTQ